MPSRDLGNREIVRGNPRDPGRWVTAHLVHYVKPRSGTTALLGYDLDVPSRQLCVELVEQTGVMLTPAVPGHRGYLRIGCANNPEDSHRGTRAHG